VVTEAGGLVKPHAGAEALARALIELLADDELRQTARTAARDYAVHHMDRKTILDGLGRSLLEVAQGKGDHADDGRALSWVED
ncbi:hypothetical protein V6C53_17945, partial [Desulfocurvibacter africanus]|uniref:glycosyltransferase n=1 Tax=Desulfocurvibacter africanus TaxID=873 RepID=UPI002FD9A3BC